MRDNRAIMGGSKPDKPKAPPPSPAPVRADTAAGEQAFIGANRRQGLQKTINPANPLAPSTALGSIGSLGTGGEGVMINTRFNKPKSNPYGFGMPSAVPPPTPISTTR